MSESAIHVMHLPVADPDRFWARRRELSALEETLVEGRRHVVVLGPAGSGRTSLLETVCEVLKRRDEDMVCVRWRPTPADLMSRWTAIRSLFSALVEHTSALGAEPAVLSRWRARVWAGQSGLAVDDLDRLTSGLMFSGPICGADMDHAKPDFDNAVLEHDLAVLRELTSASLHLVVVDDAQALTEDVALVEQLLDAFDATGWQLLLAGSTDVGRHFREAQSRCGRRFASLYLRHLPLAEVERCLTAGGQEDHRLPEDFAERFELIRGVARMAGGRPLLVRFLSAALLDHAMAAGSARFALSLPALRSAIPLLQDASRRGSEIQSLQRLRPDEIRRALAVVHFEGFAAGQIVIMRRLSLPLEAGGELSLGARAKVDENAIEGLLAELDGLEALGVLELDRAAEQFSVRGGIAGRVFYEVAARELLADGAPPPPFGLSYFDEVSSAIVGAIARRVLDKTDAQRLGQATAVAGGAGGGAGSVRTLVDRLAAGEPARVDFLDVVEAGADAEARITSDLQSEVPSDLFLLAAQLSHGEESREFFFIWSGTMPKEPRTLDERLLDAVNDAGPLLQDCGLRWHGCSATTLQDSNAMTTLAALFPDAATRTVFNAYVAGDVRNAGVVAARALSGFERYGVAGPWDAVEKRSEMANRLGFVLLAQDRREEARAALTPYAADGASWLLLWNLALAEASQDLDAAREHLRLAEAVCDSDGNTLYLHAWAGGELRSFSCGPLDPDQTRELVVSQREMLDYPRRNDALIEHLKLAAEAENPGVRALAAAAL